MTNKLTKQDLQAIGQLIDKKLDVQSSHFDAKLEVQDKRFDAKLEVQAKRYSGLLDGFRKEIGLEIRDLAQHFNQSQVKLREEIRRDTNQLLDEHQDEILSAISELILDDKIAGIERRLLALETAQ